MDWTDRHCRYFHRLIAPNAKLYTEMIVTGAIIHGDKERLLRFHEKEHPVALQLGGSDPDELAHCAEIGQSYGYDEINLNCGCPSDRVQSGRFGVCLMKEPDHVAKCVQAMNKAASVPVTVKCRIGVDDEDDFDFLDRFIGKSADKGCQTFIVHARKAWLKGLSPKENREVPPLNYERVYAIKEKYPDLRIIINGGIKAVDEIKTHIAQLDGVMIGREAYQNPYVLAEIERKIFGNHAILGREKILQAMTTYAKEELEMYGTPVKRIAKHMTGLFHHQPGAKSWRQVLSTEAFKDGATEDVFKTALNSMKNVRRLQKQAG